MSSHSFFSSEEIFQRNVVASIAHRILVKTKHGDTFRLALSGGSTPKEIYKLLSKRKDIPWSQVEIFLVDERYVPLEDKYSNYRMINDSLIKHLHNLKGFHFFDTSLPIPTALKEYEKSLNAGDPNFFDLIVLGVGSDGHTASLFPNSKGLSVSKRYTSHTTTNVFDVHDRLTLTYPALESSREIFFLLKGRDKRTIFHQLQRSAPDDRKLPAARLFKRDTTQVFFAEVD